MILRGLTVTGPGAHELGIVHEVVDDPLARALEIAAELASRGAEGLAYAKRLTRAALDRPLAEGLTDERRSFGAVMRTASAREGVPVVNPILLPVDRESDDVAARCQSWAD
jgi:enoyl-CoA hydratase